MDYGGFARKEEAKAALGRRVSLSWLAAFVRWARNLKLFLPTIGTHTDTPRLRTPTKTSFLQQIDEGGLAVTHEPGTSWSDDAIGLPMGGVL